MLSEEEDSYNKLQSAYIARKKAEDAYRKTCEDYEKHKEILASLKSEREKINASLEKTRSIIAKVDNAKEATLIDGDLESLYSQYNTHLSNLNENLERLRDNLEAEQEKKQTLEEELATYDCDESDYMDAIFSSDLLKEVRETLRKLENEKKAIQSDFDEKNREHSSAEESMKLAHDSLSDYEGVPLPKGEIGDSFRRRMQDTENEIKSFQEKIDMMNNEKSSLERLRDQVSNLLENYTDDAVTVSAVMLSNKPFEQWRRLKDDFKGLDKDVHSEEIV